MPCLAMDWMSHPWCIHTLHQVLQRSGSTLNLTKKKLSLKMAWSPQAENSGLHFQAKEIISGLYYIFMTSQLEQLLDRNF